MESATSHKFYPLRDDFVFKFVFGKEGNERLLMKLIDALLHPSSGSAILEQRDKGERDRLTELALARREGREEGKREVARLLVESGLPPEEVATRLKLSLREIEAALAPRE